MTESNVYSKYGLSDYCQYQTEWSIARAFVNDVIENESVSFMVVFVYVSAY